MVLGISLLGATLFATSVGHEITVMVNFVYQLGLVIAPSYLVKR